MTQERLRAIEDHLGPSTMCQGKDPYLDLPTCRCPELAGELTFSVDGGDTKRFRWVCSCCFKLYPGIDKRHPVPPMAGPLV